MNNSRCLPALLIAALGLLPSAAGRSIRVTLPPAEVDRAAQVVTFKLPADAPLRAVLQSANGAALAVQVGADGIATVVVPGQKARETLAFTLTAAPAVATEVIEVRKAGGRLHVVLGGAPLFDYQMDKEALPRADIKPEYKRAGYLHPIYTPAGTIVSDDYPAQHVHHHGIWAPWTKTSFQGRTPDFWNMAGPTGGTVEFVALDRTWDGPVHGGFVARHRFVDRKAVPEPVVALHETWVVTAYNVPAAGGGAARVFDLTLTQTCATNDPLILPKYHYGGLGYRGRGEWFGRDKAAFLTSEGETDRVKANALKMRWVHISGAVTGGTAGLAVLGHPENFRAPQPVRVHPTEPYVSFTPSNDGDWQIDPGKPYVARYRFVTADGAPDRARLDAFWNGYAAPATAKIEVVP